MNWLKFDYIPETDVKQFVFTSQRSNEYQMTINGKSMIEQEIVLCS